MQDWVLNHWDQGLRDGPVSTVIRSRPTLQFRLLSVTYFVLIVLIMNAVMSGIIIDAFAAQREFTESVEEDKETIDFVSGISKGRFEQANIDFDSYIKKYHNPWHYCAILPALVVLVVSSFAAFLVLRCF